MAQLIAKIEHRIAGIPCLIAVSNFVGVKGSYSYNAASDLDYYGYVESDWFVMDRRGRHAPWLERKVDKHEEQLIEDLIKTELGE